MTTAPSTLDADVAIVGSGFAGALTALALRQRGRRVALIERGRHPRFAIGESSTPLANLLLEELADRYDLPRIRPFSKWGTWQRTRPGRRLRPEARLQFFFHELGRAVRRRRRRTRSSAARRRQPARRDRRHALVPARLRSRARARGGARAAPSTSTRRASRDPAGERRADARGHAPTGARSASPARFVIDASGPRGFLHGALGPGERRRDGCRRRRVSTRTSTASTRWDRRARRRRAPPYPSTTPALHHVFPGGWIWVLRFNNGITSAGAALTDPLAAALACVRRRSRPGIVCLRGCLPFATSSATARADAAVRATRRAWRSAAHGRRRELGAAAVGRGVIDPLLSTGFPLTLLGIARLLDLLETTFAGAGTRGALADTRGHTGGAGRDGAARRGALRDHGRLRRCSSASASSTSPRRASARPSAALAARSWPRVPALRHPRSVPSWRLRGGARRRRRRARGALSLASIARSIRSTLPACSTAPAATGIRRSPPTSSSGPASFKTTPDDIVERLPYLFAVPR